jgi:uncharacterized membrane protein YphA (DoxX/SURF4 family)
MKSILNNAILILLIRVFIGGLLVVASLDKIIAPDAFVVSILNYKVIATPLAILTATFLPWLELVCGLGLILGLYSRASLMIILTLLVVFTVLVSSAFLRGLDISCGCFSQDPNVSKIGFQKILENCGLIILGIYLFIYDKYDIELTRLFKKQSTQATDTKSE